MKSFMRFLPPGAFLTAALIFGGCSRSSNSPTASNPAALAPLPEELKRFGRPDAVVKAGQSIQAAVDAASPGAVIHIEAGTYSQSVTVYKAGIKLIGLTGPNGEGVVLENPGGVDCGIMVTDAGDGFALLNVTVRNFEENGVYLEQVDGFYISNVTAIDNVEYGIYPVRSTRGVIERCSATGSEDTGIYVGRSTGVTVRNCTAFGNVNGIEVHNCSNIKLLANESYDNVAGILVALLPAEAVNVSSGILISGNHIHDNNHVNFAEPGTSESFVPSGSGILVIGADRAIVEENRVTGNKLVGIALGSSLLFGALAGLPPEAFANIEPNPDRARISNNVVTGNGSDPPPLPIPLPGADLLWDGSGVDNCWSGNTSTINFPESLPACD